MEGCIVFRGGSYFDRASRRSRDPSDASARVARSRSALIHDVGHRLLITVPPAMVDCGGAGWIETTKGRCRGAELA